MTDPDRIREACNAENNSELPEGCMHPWCLCNRYPEPNMTPPREAPDQDIVGDIETVLRWKQEARAQGLEGSVLGYDRDLAKKVPALVAEIIRLRSERQDGRLREALEQARTPLRAIAMNAKKYGPLYSHAMQALHAIEAALSATAGKP